MQTFKEFAYGAMRPATNWLIWWEKTELKKAITANNPSKIYLRITQLGKLFFCIFVLVSNSGEIQWAYWQPLAVVLVMREERETITFLLHH